MLAVIDTVAADLGNTRAVLQIIIHSAHVHERLGVGSIHGAVEQSEIWEEARVELLADENTAINYMREHEDDEFQFSKN